jgi:hypothetical protein
MKHNAHLVLNDPNDESSKDVEESEDSEDSVDSEDGQDDARSITAGHTEEDEKTDESGIANEESHAAKRSRMRNSALSPRAMLVSHRTSLE